MAFAIDKNRSEKRNNKNMVLLFSVKIIKNITIDNDNDINSSQVPKLKF